MAKRVMSYMGHVIWKEDDVFAVALKRDGTDDYFETIEGAMKAIEEHEETALTSL